MPIQTLFDGVTISPAREFVAKTLTAHKPARVYMPCAGRFAALTALVASGYKPERIVSSDISLFSSIIGYLADPRHTLDELQIRGEGIAERFIGTEADPVQRAAGTMLALQWLRTKQTNIYGANIAREVYTNRDVYRAHIAEQLTGLLEKIKGIRFDNNDVRDEILLAAAEGPDTGLYVNLPGYAGGYTRMYGSAEGALNWKGVEVAEFTPGESVRLLGELSGKDTLALAYRRNPKEAPDDWTPVYAHHQKGERVDYIFSNHALGDRFLVDRIPFKSARQFEIYDDQEITPDSVISIVPVDEHTALYYRDLFVHRLGTTQAEAYFLLLIDNRVITAFGLAFRDVHLGRSEYIGEVFGISKTSVRYARLGKLFMLCLTSGDMRRYLMSSARSRFLAMSNPRGIQTTSITQHEEGKTDRSVMKLVFREPLKKGGFRLIYRADFRADTWGDVIGAWLKRWGEKQRG